MHYAYKNEQDQIVTGIIEHNRVHINRSFCNDHGQEYDETGMDELWRQWAHSHMGGQGTLEVAPSKLTSKGSAPFISLDHNKYGEPILPNPTDVPKGYTPTTYYDALTRTFLSTHFALAMGVFERRVKIHWAALVREGVRRFIDEEYLPDDMADRFDDPCRVGEEGLLSMLSFWYDRQQKGCDVVFEFSHWLRYRRAPRQHEIIPRAPRQLAPTVHEPVAQQNDEDQPASPTKDKATRKTSKHRAAIGKKARTDGSKVPGKGTNRIESPEAESSEDEDGVTEPWTGSQDGLFDSEGESEDNSRSDKSEADNDEWSDEGGDGLGEGGGSDREASGKEDGASNPDEGDNGSLPDEGEWGGVTSPQQPPMTPIKRNDRLRTTETRRKTLETSKNTAASRSSKQTKRSTPGPRESTKNDSPAATRASKRRRTDNPEPGAATKDASPAALRSSKRRRVENPEVGKSSKKGTATRAAALRKIARSPTASKPAKSKAPAPAVVDSPAKNTRSRAPAIPDPIPESSPTRKANPPRARKKPVKEKTGEEQDVADIDALFDLRKGRNPPP